MSMSPEGFEDRPVPVRPLDGDQARLLEILHAAGGKPVPFAELRSLGIDNPAVLCYELEIAGVPIAHVERPRRGAAPVPVGVQLDEEWFAAPPPPEEPLWRERVLGLRESLAAAAQTANDRSRTLGQRHAARRQAREPTNERPRERSVGGRADAAASRAHEAWAQSLGAGARGLGAASAALAGLLARARGGVAHTRAHLEEADIDWDLLSARRTRAGVLVGVAALVIVIALAIALGSSSAPRRSSAGLAGGQNRAHPAGLRGSTGSSGAAHQSAPPQTGASEGAPSDASRNKTGAENAGRATQLQAEGHRLLAEGHDAAAAADLRAAIAASGGSPARCQEPSTESCLAYAYALYDLGRALQAQDKPGQAIPVLNERLHIDNQRQTVRAQLHSAREQMHTAGSHPRSRRSRARAHGPDHPSGSSPHANATPSPGGPEATGEQPQLPTSNPAPPSEGGAESSGSPTHGGAAGPPSTND